MSEYRRRVEATLSDDQRCRAMVAMRRRGWSYARIGRVVGMSPTGVMLALRRTQEPERYYEKLDEEVEPDAPGDDEEW